MTPDELKKLLGTLPVGTAWEPEIVWMMCPWSWWISPPHARCVHAGWLFQDLSGWKGARMKLSLRYELQWRLHQKTPHPRKLRTREAVTVDSEQHGRQEISLWWIGKKWMPMGILGPSSLRYVFSLCPSLLIKVPWKGQLDRRLQSQSDTALSWCLFNDPPSVSPCSSVRLQSD